jgi:L-Ala-D/L-Glu epimerase
MLITKITLHKYSIPMVPFTIATGTMNFAQNLLLHIHTNTGLVGIGECSAFPMIVGETQGTCYLLAQDFANIWVGKNALDITERLAELDQYIAGNTTVKSAFDMALYDLAAKQQQQPLYQYLGGSYKEPVSDLTIGIGPVATMAATAVDFVKNRAVTILKVKLGKDVATDVERIKAIRTAVGPAIAIRIDANQGWTYEQAVAALTAMEPYNIQFCEQPMRTHNDHLLPALRAQTTIKIMADESVYNHYDATRLITNNACDLVNIKVCKAGGIAQSLKIHEVCKAKNIPNMLGGMLESRVALTAFVHLALACSNIIYYDMDTCLLGHLVDPVINGVNYKGMQLQVPNLPGIGASVDPAFLNKCEQITIAI